MSYKVLYRKYRPNTFSEIIGQHSIIENLKNSIVNDSFSHAYMFTGPRGTGKTSTAKVLAKAINCIDHSGGDICGKCESCRNFMNSPDIIEIDAASNNGVDEIRELRSNITHVPTESKYKIYIIDEVHMLSPGAFNALLKTLEEPPAHAIFILATTEVYKVPITILSRCQRYDFTKIEKEVMIEHLKTICQKEGIKYDDSALSEIYSLSEGCLRDALSILDQISKTEEGVTLENIQNSYNTLSDRAIEKLLEHIKNGEVEKIITTVEEYENSGMNAQKMLKKIIDFLERLAINIKLKKDNDYDFLMINSLIRNLNGCYIDARINENTFAMIKLCFLEVVEDTKIGSTITSSNGLTANANRDSLENVPKTEEPKIIAESHTTEYDKPKNICDLRINNCFAGANKEALKTISDIWNNLDKKKMTAVNIDEYKPVAASDEYAIFTTEESSLADLFNIKKELIEKCLKKDITIKVVALTEANWSKEKKKYIKRIKDGKRYTFIEEPEPKDDTNEIRGQLGDLFTEKLVEIS